MREQKKENKGITLIALVVTIIIIIILAAVSLNVIMNNNGIVQKAEEATKNYENAFNNEMESIGQLKNEMDEFLAGTQFVTNIQFAHEKEQIRVGDSLALEITITPDNADNKEVTWESSNTDIVVVNENGMITGKGIGKATITVTAKDGKKQKATCEIEVLPGVQFVTNIKFAHEKEQIQVGDSLALQITITPDNADNKEVTWESSNTDIVVVNENGMITGKGIGKATITVTAKDGKKQKATCEIEVFPKTQFVTNIQFAHEKEQIKVGDSLALQITISPDNADNKEVTWESSNTGIVVVDANGVITGRAVGKATITVTAKDEKKQKATCEIEVKYPTVGSKIEAGKYINYELPNGVIMQCVSLQNADNNSGVPMASVRVLENLSLVGSKGFDSAVNQLNGIANNYINAKYVQSARSVRISDWNALSTFGIQNAGQDYWFADTQYNQVGSGANYDQYYYVGYSSGIQTSYFTIYQYHYQNGGDSYGGFDFSATKGVRAIFTLKPGVQVIDGDGSSARPYKLYSE